MQRTLLKDIMVNELYCEKLYQFTDDYGVPILLPTLYTFYLLTKGAPRFIQKKEGNDINEYLETHSISSSSCASYISAITNYVTYFETNLPHTAENIQQLECVTQQFVNHYINTVLTETGDSPEAFDTRVHVIKSFYSFLSLIKVREPFNIDVYRKSKARVRQLYKKPNVFKFIGREQRHYLLNATDTQQERLSLRMGLEVGLRAAEVAGIEMHRTNRKSGAEQGIIALFEELESHPDKQEFSYLLIKNTKGEKPRYIHFERELLTEMKRYWEVERKDVVNEAEYKKMDYKEPNRLFLQTNGTAFPAEKATEIFNKAKYCVKHIDLNLTFHCCRHTFATIKYHQFRFKDGKKVGSTDTALLGVAQLLGHTLPKKGCKFPLTTFRYIAMCDKAMEAGEL